ncbi:secreted RxLR effector protein 161-like [Raphanus sativus]|uniref:Secreted RxLR effector protein 161-like n=1 Tax=Raphanus sativus TaxID=3726 RepID=A0A6J0MX24_RAPSA|nr:secreted RxLR effector protein 161-like [Raphanus sativus]
MVTGTKLSKVGNGTSVDPTSFKQLVGSLRYLTATRPDLIYLVNMVSRFMESPGEPHLAAAKRNLRYVKGTSDFGIQYRRSRNAGLVRYVDSNYAEDEDYRKSTTGYAFMLRGGAVSWDSKKQPIVTMSTIEAEYVDAVYGA